MPRPLSILYIANIRLPTEKAHGVAIMKMSEALVHAGAQIRLVVSRRYTTLVGDPFAIYGMSVRFPLTRIWVVDLFPLNWVRRGLAFWLESATFYAALFVWLLPQSRRPIVYTRDIGVVGIAWLLNFNVVYECHAIAGRRGFFFLARRARRIVVISTSQRRAFVSAGVAPERILTAPSGVDVTLFAGTMEKADARAQLGLSQTAFLAVYTGGFTTMGADKGVYDIFDALKIAQDIEFVGVGAQPYDIERYHREAIARNISARTTLIGYVSQSKVALYQAAADVLLMPYPKSHYQHHLSPMKMFEYMASRRPVIASDLPTVREVIDEGSALLVPPGDATALAAALNRLRTEPELGAKLAERAFGLVGQYSWQERGRQVLNFIA